MMNKAISNPHRHETRDNPSHHSDVNLLALDQPRELRKIGLLSRVTGDIGPRRIEQVKQNACLDPFG